MSDLSKLRKEVEEAQFLLRCNTEASLGAQKTLAEVLLKIIDLLEEKLGW